MEVTKIFFDMDGVLADFDGGVIKICGLQPVKQGSGSDEFEDLLWETIAKVGNFYDKLEPIEGAPLLFQIVLEKYKERCEILTGIPKPSRNIVTAASDKVAWTRRLLSETVVINTVLRKDKIKFCTDRGCILIDDYEKNISEWEKAGGTGVLFTGVEQTMQKLKNMGIL